MRKGARTVADVTAAVERALPEASPDARKAAILSFAYGDPSGSQDERLQRAVASAVRRVAAQAARSPKPAGWVKGELEAAFRTIAEEFADVMISPRADLLEQAARFTGHTAGEFAERLRGEGGYPWPETREGLIAFALKHGRRYSEREGDWPSVHVGQINGLETTWVALDSMLRYRWGLSLREVFGRPSPAPRRCYEENARAIRAFFDLRGRWPSREAKNAEERRLGVALSCLRTRRLDLLDKYGIPRQADKSATARAARGREQWVSVVDLVPRFCAQPAASQYTPNVGSDTGRALQQALQNAANPNRRGQSRGLGATPEALAVLCQVNSISRLQAEIRADCWRLWLDGSETPDPRPWAEILAAGDNVRVARAERVAFLDWDDPTGPTAHDWRELGKTVKRQVAARRPWPGARWPDLHAPAQRKPRKAPKRAAAANGVPADDLAAAE